MKKWKLVVLAAVLVLVMTACGKDANVSADGKNDTVQSDVTGNNTEADATADNAKADANDVEVVESLKGKR